MAVDSHTDNHYELAIDNVNNNNNSTKKNLHRGSIKLESRDDDFGLNPVNDDSAECSESQKGSARRKYTSVSKGISIEEFLLKQDRQVQLTAIDKLIQKNKTALQNLQMKQTRTKPAPAAGTAATNGKAKKEPKPRKEKVLGSKVAAARKRVANAVTTEAKNTKSAAAAKKAKIVPAKVEEPIKGKGKIKRTSSESKKVVKKEAPGIATAPIFAAVKKSKPSVETVEAIKVTCNKEGNAIKVKTTAIEIPQSIKVKNTNVDNKRSIKNKGIGARKPPIRIKPKKINKNERLLDARGFKPNVSHKTRSFTKVVKLRNGKSRIIADKTAPPSPPQRKYNRRSANTTLNNSSTSETLVNGTKSSAPFKRSIKQEPIDDDAGVKRKRRKTAEKVNVSAPIATNEPIPAPEEAAIETTPILDQMPTLVKQETQSPIPKVKPAIEETPGVLEENSDLLVTAPVALEPPVIDQESTSSIEMIVDEAPIIEEDQLSVDPIIDEQSEPPMLSPQPPISSTLSIDDVIVIDSSPEAPDIEEIETPPPVIPPSVPVPVKNPTPVIKDLTLAAKEPTLAAKDPTPATKEPFLAAKDPTPATKEPTLVTEATPAKPDDQLEDTATETSDDTEGDEEFGLQDANTESEDIIDEDITLHYETDDEDSTDKDIAREPTAAAVATAVDPVQEPKEPVESAKEEIAPVPVVEEPKVTPSQEKPKQPDTKVQDRPENKAVKESILGALGLTSLEKVQQKVKENNNYTGTLKAVIKIDKGCRRMELKPKDAGVGIEGFQNENVLSFYSKTLSNKFDQVSDSASGMLDKGDSEMQPVNDLDSTSYKNKCHDDGLLSSLREGNIRAMETDYNGMIDPVSGQLAKEKTKAAASLVVPEKSSSFSIHPNRLCSDVCKYCFGKFGSLDTPCHVGQMKNPERQRKILLCEPNLKLDTCLCDACYRFVDRKANKPPQKRNKNNMRRSISINQRSLGPCVIQNCTQFARHTVKRKWLLRISKKIAKLSFDVNKGGPRMRYGLCSQHYYLVDFYTLCGICKKRLNRNHMYSIRSELNDLNNILDEDSIPIKLMDNMLLCKLCHYYMSLRLKYGNSSKMSPSNRQYYQNFRKKILIYYNVAVSDSEDTITSECLKYETSDCMESHSPESLSQSTKMIEELAASSSKPPTVTTTTTTSAPSAESKRPSSGSSSSSKKSNHNVGFRDIADLLKPLEGDGDKNSSTRIQVKFGNLNIGKLSNLNIGQNSSTHQNEPKHDKSGDKDVPLIADFCFKTPADGQKNWEKCVSTILFDKGTKKLWQDLQKPYGNQSSFIRHLIMLEKYWRSGAMVLAGNADPGAVKYINSVKNRIQSLETSSSPSPSPSPAPPQVAVAKPPPMPTLKPATSSAVENGTSSVRYAESGLSKTSSVRYAESGSSKISSVRYTEGGSSKTSSTVRYAESGSSKTSSSVRYAESGPSKTSSSVRYAESGPPKTSSSVRYAESGQSKTSPVESRTSNVNVRHTPAPPPLLKIDQMNGIPFNVSNKTPVSSESKVQYQNHAPKPITPRIADVSLEQYVEMMHPQPRTKHLTQVSNGSVKGLGISLLKKSLPTMPTMKPIHIANSSSAETLASSSTPKIAKKSASMMYVGSAPANKPKDRPRYNVYNMNMPPLTAISSTSTSVSNSSSMIIAKLPKALTVTQIDEPASKDKAPGEKPPHIAAPFLAGEKPSVSVFREITK